MLGIAGEVLWLIFGGLLLGFGVGWSTSHLLQRIDDHLIVITVTVAMAYGMYLLGTAIHTSGLLAVVGAGLVMGSYGRKNAMSPRTIEAADDVWDFITYLANSLLFLLLGFELALTHIVQSFQGIFFGLLGAVIGREFDVREAGRREGDPPVLVAAVDRARERLGWTAAVSTLDEIIGSAWNWHRNRFQRRPETE